MEINKTPWGFLVTYRPTPKLLRKKVIQFEIYFSLLEKYGTISLMG
ncbi:MAG: hypothetical protein GX288_01155 [Clostridiales bacterium]|nr:hypothetical protein [Clostridiales bacterium]